MERRRLVAHHHTNPALRFRLQTTNVPTYSLLVRDVTAFKQPLPEGCSVLFDVALLRTSFKAVASSLVKISGPKSLPHRTSELFPCHRRGIPVLNPEPVCRLTGEVHHGSGSPLGYWDTILHLKVQIHLEQPRIQHSCTYPPSKWLWQLKLQGAAIILSSPTRHMTKVRLHNYIVHPLGHGRLHSDWITSRRIRSQSLN